jgi:hypothetical protein
LGFVWDGFFLRKNPLSECGFGGYLLWFCSIADAEEWDKWDWMGHGIFIGVLMAA